jgi:hypothetical protein
VHIGRSWLYLLAAILTIARNWVSSLGKLAMYSSFTIYIYSRRAVRAGDRLGERIGIKVLRKDYLVKVLAVPISLRVEKGR